MIRVAPRWLLSAMSLLCLSACGGGGGGDSGPPAPSPTRPTLSVSSNTLSFDARVPGVEVASQVISATVSNPQQLSGTLYVLVTATGTAVRSIDNVFVEGATGTARVTPALSEIIGTGTHMGTISVRACLNSANCSSGELAGSPQSINVTYTVGAFSRRHAFVVSEKGIGFAALPSRSFLTRSVHVSDSLEHAVPWSATSNQAWLNVTTSGVTPGDLTVTASPAGLAADQTHFATITVTSGESGVSQSESIRVGLWVGSQNPVSPVQIPGGFVETITDPIRPLAYSHSGGDTLSVHQVYTGELVATIPVGKALGEMAVAPDGSRLFVADSNGIGTTVITPIDLETLAVVPAWAPLNPSGYLSHLEYVRLDGMEFIITGRQHVVNASTGAQIPTAGDFITDDFGWNSNVIVASRSGSLVCSLVRGNSGGGFDCYQMQYTDEGGAVAVFHRLDKGATGGYTRDAVMRPDGSRLYAASYRVASYALPFPSFLGELPALTQPNNLELLPDGRLLVGASFPYDGAEVRIYGSNDAALGDFRLVSTVGWSLLDDQLKVSADGLRIVSLSQSIGIPQGMQLSNTP